MLIHIEIQTTREGDFPRGMFVYNYRVYDRYNRPVASLAVLADDDVGWRPTEFHSSVFGCETGIRFPAVKLLDFAAHEATLEASDNSFAKAVLAHLKALETRADPVARQAWKIRLVRGLYERGFNAKDVRELFRVIDWMMELPPPLAEVFRQEVDKIQEEKRMPFVTSYERSLQWKSLRLGIETALRIRFGEEGVKLMPEIQAIYDAEQLEAILKTCETPASPEEVRRLCTPTSP